jgi:glycosyltransferase involved in cell wall biosynthesis
MKILFVGKRRPQQRDLIERPYGRFHHLPAGLAGLGHEVRVLLISHRRLPSVQVYMVGVDWIGEDVRNLGPRVLYRRLVAQARSFRPHWVVGMSDAWYGWLARRLAISTGARLAIDAYDNYEAYMPWNLPLHWAWQRSARRADLLTVAGPSLAELLGGGRTDGSTLVLPMAPDPVGFVPGNMAAARARLGLPADVPLVAFGGGMHPSRDLKTLFGAVESARQHCPQLKLVLSGRKSRGVELPADALWLGYLPDDAMPALYQAVDVVAVMNTPGAFGDYSYPIKLYEAMACGRPVVASRTASTAWILRDHPQRLVPAGDPGALADALVQALSERSVDYGPLPTWGEGADALEGALTRIAAG